MDTLEKDIDYLDKAQINHLLDVAAQNPRDALLIRVLWRTGMRVSELVNVKYTDIEFGNGVIYVSTKRGTRRKALEDDDKSKLLNRKYTDTEFNNGSNIRKTKKDRSRRVPLDSDTLGQIKKHVTDKNIPHSTPIFDITRQHVHTLIKWYGDKIGVDIHPHTLRHSFAIYLVRSGISIRLIQRILGISDLGSMQSYLKFDDADIKQVYDMVTF
ncbi:MAG: tyrosine-type recombinase/integrase [Halobacteriota archaeon]